MPIPHNPYRAGDSVGNTDAFVGREDILREVLQVLNNPAQNAITLYGQRRIGKTSILQYLQRNLPLEGGFRPIYFDLQDKSNSPLSVVLAELARTIAEKLSLPAPILNSKDAEVFRIWLKNVVDNLPENVSLVLLFDEFDVLADPKAFSVSTEFFPYLRNLLTLSPTHLQFIFVLGRNITDLSSITLSVFKGSHSIHVSLLTKADTYKLAYLSEKNQSLLWTEESVGEVWNLTHGHPYLTQALCSQVWETVYEEELTEVPKANVEMVKSAVVTTLRSSNNMLEWLWSGLGPAEKVVSAAMAGVGRDVVTEAHLEEILRDGGIKIIIRELKNAPELLKAWDILEPTNGGYVFRVEMLRSWIASKHPINRVQEELDRILPAADVLFQAARASYTQGNLPDAEKLLQQSIGINPNHLSANELLAEILISDNRLSEAREKLEKLLENAPINARPRLVQVYLLQAPIASDNKTRRELFEKALSLDANCAEAREGLEKIKQFEFEEKELTLNFIEGRQALQMGNWIRAIELLQNVIAKRPSFTGDRQKDSETAADLLARAIHEDKSRLPKWRIWLRQPRSQFILGGIFVLLFLFLFFGMGQKLVSIGTQGYGPLKGLATPTFTLTPTATMTHKPTFTPTITATNTLTPTVTSTPSPTPIPKLGDVWQRPSDNMEMIFVPAGTFMMGSNNNSDEFIHSVTLPSFWTDKTEVTNAMYKSCVDANEDANEDAKGCTEPERLGSYFTDINSKDFPVVYVTWFQAVSYCKWAGKDKDGKPLYTIELPSEEEWEYAARGTDGRIYPWGDKWACAKANASGIECDPFSKLAPVNNFANGASPFGILDMAGNAWEWVFDVYDRYPGDNSIGNSNFRTGRRVLRGGSWYSASEQLRVSYRSYALQNYFDNDIGFRCIRRLP